VHSLAQDGELDDDPEADCDAEEDDRNPGASDPPSSSPGTGTGQTG
jgi:hypothetical protein